MFELVDNHLAKIGRRGLLPAGIVLTGGGSGITTAEDLAKSVLQLPSKIAALTFNETPGNVKDAFWSVAYGLCVLGLTDDGRRSSGMNIGAFFKKILDWFKQFLP